MQIQNPVLDRAANLTLRECHRLDQLAYAPDAPTVDVDLQAAMEAALQATRQDRVIPLATALGRAFAMSQCHDLYRPGAMTCAWAAALACGTWGQLDPDTIHELTWRWQSVTRQPIGDIVESCQERFGVARTIRRREAQELLDLALEAV